jgi:ABC-type transport system substrate-binding protein
MRLVFSIAVLVIFFQANARELIVPTPELPSVFDPAKSLDVFSNSAIRQVHRSLFKLNSAGEPVLDLLASFDISKDGLTYSLQLAPAKFSDGTPFSSAHVKAALKRALALKVNGHQKLYCLKGYSDFLGKKASDISGLRIKSDSVIELKLKCKVSQLPYLFSDLRFAIVRSEKKPEIGLGPYRVIRESDGKTVELASVESSAEFSMITYRKATADEAINLVQNPKLDVVVFSYKFTPEQIESLKNKAHFLQMRSWTNYFLAINSARNGELSRRKAIFQRVDKEKLIRDCFANETSDDNIFPYGFPGYVKGFKRIGQEPVQVDLAKEKILVTILNGVGSEDCLKQGLASQLGSGFEVEILSTDSGLSKWIANRTDVLLFYLESELNMDVSQFFVHDAEFFLGERKDNKILSLVQALQAPGSANLFQENALALQNRVLDQQLLLPLFVPKSELALSKHLTVPDLGMIPPTYLNLKDVKAGGAK